MKTILLRTAVLSLCLAICSALYAADQPAGFSRKVLADQDLSTPGKHGVTALITFAPGAVAPKHRHPGEEFACVIEGSVVIEVEGQPARTLQAGEAMVIPAGVAHLAHNAGTVPAKIVSTYFLEKGQPLASPVK